MRCLMRNKRELYWCSEYEDNGISKYTKPEKIHLNYQATNSEGDLIALGMDFPMYVRIKADITDANKFKAGDRFYIGVTPNVTFDILAKDADYEINSDPIVSLNSVEITLKKLSGK